jgi:hypothetical protein
VSEPRTADENRTADEQATTATSAAESPVARYDDPRAPYGRAVYADDDRAAASEDRTLGVCCDDSLCDTAVHELAE